MYQSSSERDKDGQEVVSESILGDDPKPPGIIIVGTTNKGREGLGLQTRDNLATVDNQKRRRRKIFQGEIRKEVEELVQPPAFLLLMKVRVPRQHQEMLQVSTRAGASYQQPDRSWWNSADAKVEPPVNSQWK